MKARLTRPGSGRITAAVALTAALAACSAPAGGGGTISVAPGVTACHNNRLLVVRDPHAARTSAGSVYLPIDFVNKSGTTCSLAGYPRVLGIAVNPHLNTKAARVSGSRVLVVLKPSYSAHSWVQIRHVPGHQEAGCTPFTGAGFRVYAPGSATHTWITYPFTSCVTANQAALAVLPIRQGLANPAIFP